MITVGFYKGHNATACILKDGQIMAAVSEERFNRIKNADVFPKEAINYCLKEVGISASDVDFYVRIYEHPEGYVSPVGQTKIPRLMNLILFPLPYLKKLIFQFPSFGFFLKKAYIFISKYLLSPYFQNQFRKNMAQFLGIDDNKIKFVNHHLAHAYSAYYGFVSNDDRNKNQLVITLDGEGDGICGTVWTVKSGQWKKISQTSGGNSIATFYGLVTHFLGMKMNEHEYKVMGLAPYVSPYETEKVYSLFRNLFWVDEDLVMHSKFPSGSLLYYFDKVLAHQRFDGIAASAQKLAEELVVQLVTKAIKKTGIKNVVLSGGFFMNVKANKKIAEIKTLESLIVCPSAGDESAPFGGAFFGYQLLSGKSPNNVSNLYLGPFFSDKEIKNSIEKRNGRGQFRVKKYNDIEQVIAKLLADGKIVGRFKGRMEWGARALGNRSILMDPSRVDLKQRLNDQIKSRDFWMPFAATVLAERASDYIINDKKLKASYMALGFDTTEKGKKDLAAAIHPYDFTCRPQILKKSDNPDYYKLIKYFEAFTDIGAVLNTSFNYHGEPIVLSPSDALHTFEATDLEYLAIGNYLLKKNDE